MVTRYGADPHVLGRLFGALGAGAIVGALVERSALQGDLVDSLA